MKNLMLYVVEDAGADLDSVRRLLRVQVDNSLDLGWSADDILLFTSFPFGHRGVQAVDIAPARRPRTARVTSFHKTECILRAFEVVPAGEVIWYHDVDAFQLLAFDSCPLSRDLAFCLYSTRERLLVQGGSLFFTHLARPVFDYVRDQLTNHRCRKDEFALTDAMTRFDLTGRFEVLDSTFNLGATDFEVRYQLADKPIRVAHFHPERADHLAIFADGHNGLAARPLDGRFLGLLERHGYLRPGRRAPAPAAAVVRPPTSNASTGTLARVLRRALAGG